MVNRPSQLYSSIYMTCQTWQSVIDAQEYLDLVHIIPQSRLENKSSHMAVTHYLVSPEFT